MENTPGPLPGIAAEHGLSLYIETARHRLLMDGGPSLRTWENAALLGVDPREIDTVILSHGHYDHSGGLARFLAGDCGARAWMQRSAAGEYYNGERYIGIDKALLALPRLELLEGDTAIDEELALHTGVSGRRLWPRGNLALSERVNGAAVQDRFAHEQFLVVREGERPALFSGCAHNGILNILDRFRALYGCAPRAVVSGFHMMKQGGYTPEETEELRRTAEELAAMPTVFYTGHCTGQAAYELLAPVMGEKLRPLHAGERFTI